MGDYMNKFNKIILFSLLIMTITFGTNVYANGEVSKVKGFKGKLRNNSIVLSWESTKSVDGYMLYKNNMILKKIKASKKQFVDKKVKKNKTYSYYIVAYKKTDSQVVTSKKTYTIKIKKYTKKSKKQNVSRVTGTNKTKSVGINESIRLSAKPKVEKGLKKKKVYSKKLYWSSSDKSLATVDQKGKVTANSEMKTGMLKIYARAHSGVKKAFKVKVINYAKPDKFNDFGMVYELISPIIHDYKEDTCNIASYFYKHPVKNKTSLDIDIDMGDLFINTNPKIEIEDKKIYETILNEMYKTGITIEVDSNKISFCRNQYFSTGGIFIYRIHYFFKEESDFYASLNFNYAKIAPRWYYEEEEHYSKSYLK